MKNALILAIAMGLSVPASCVAAEWQLVAISDKDERNFINGSSLTSVGKLKKAWMRRDYAQARNTLEHPSKEYLSTVQLVYFDCKGNSSATVRIVYYAEQGGSGEVVDNADRAFANDLLVEAVPGSVGDQIIKSACGTPEYRAQRHKMLSSE